MNLKSRMPTVETLENEIEALYNWIDYSNLNRLWDSTTTPISKLSDSLCLTYNMLKSPKC